MISQLDQQRVSIAMLQFLFAIGVVYGLTLIAWGLLRRHLFKHHTGIPEIEQLGKTVSPKQKLDGTALICGGSIAGLLAARVCSEFFERVIIVEPEEWLISEDGMRRYSWEQEHKRTRIMQYQSLHGNMALLYTGLEKLFPDLEEQCRYSGIPVGPADKEMNFAGTPILSALESYNGHLPKTLLCSRAGLETLLRRLVLGRGNYPNIVQIAGTVIGVSPQSDNSSRISQVRVRKADMSIEELDASLVVDCTGPTRAGVKWLSQSGYSTTKIHADNKLSLQDAKISFDQKLHYSTITCIVNPDILKKLPIPNLETGFLEDSSDRGRRLFVITRTDGNRVLIFVGQSSDESIKHDSLDDVRALAQDFKIYKDPLPQWIFKTLDILEESQPEMHVSHVRVNPTTYIQYHQTANLPSNFIALGDSVMSIDPIYGQGCTKAFLGAAVLHSLLSTTSQVHTKELPTNFSEQFFKEHYNKTDGFWQLTHLLDYGVPSTIPLPGEDLQKGSILRWYLRRLQILAIKDPQAARVYWDGCMGFGTSIDAFHPWVMLKTLLGVMIG